MHAQGQRRTWRIGCAAPCFCLMCSAVLVSLKLSAVAHGMYLYKHGGLGAIKRCHAQALIQQAAMDDVTQRPMHCNSPKPTGPIRTHVSLLGMWCSCNSEHTITWMRLAHMRCKGSENRAKLYMTGCIDYQLCHPEGVQHFKRLASIARLAKLTHATQRGCSNPENWQALPDWRTSPVTPRGGASKCK